MSSQQQSADISFKPVNNPRLINLCGPCNEHLQQIEDFFGVEICQRGNAFHISGYEQAIDHASHTLNQLYRETSGGQLLTPAIINALMHQYTSQEAKPTLNSYTPISAHHKTIKARNKHQQDYIDAIHHHDINFAIGPAGTGKTYLAVACAVEALEKGQVERLIFVRPAVEAGEKLGFLPGDLAEKLLPYLRPLYDALYEFLGFEQAKKLIARDTIEIAPLAFMRGRTLSNAFIILDEAQNTTILQMKMFLTRIGYGSTAVITGDDTQTDLPIGTPSGLNHATAIIKDINNIGITHFEARDAVRHPLVSRIIEAYEKTQHDKETR
ncbi:MAG: PhoH family protein [Gammaproteobacteria bacterium]